MESRRRRRVVVAGAACASVIIAIFVFRYLPATAPFPTSLPILPPGSKSTPKDRSTSSPPQAPLASDVGSPSSDGVVDSVVPQQFEHYGLSSEQCNKEFSKLFIEVDRSVAHRKNVGNVSSFDIDLDWKKNGAVRAMIYNQKLHILESKIGDGKGFHPARALGILHQIDRAIIASPEPIPDIEFSFVITDAPDKLHAQHTYWALTRLPVDENTWLMPDFGYWSWPLDLVGAYEQIREDIKANEMEWDMKIPKALWRGAVNTNDVRSDLMKVTRNRDWADVEEVKWKNRTAVEDNAAGSAVPMVNHCAYQYLIHTEGNSYSGRGKYLLNCGSVVIMHKGEWIEPYQDALVSSGPDQNFVEVERDFSDLEEKIQQLLSDPQRAETIAENGAKIFRDRYLTPAAQACYWRRLFQAWAGVSFQPEPWEVIDGEKGLRGTPFETFVVQALQKPDDDCSAWKKLTLQC